jgi:monofunctional chorismate mutase
MKTIEELRLEINSIDKEIASLFEKRMYCAKEIAQNKLELNLPILDQNRENEIIERNSKYVEDDMKDYYISLLKKMMELSKDYQTKIINKNK